MIFKWVLLKLLSSNSFYYTSFAALLLNLLITEDMGILLYSIPEDRRLFKTLPTWVYEFQMSIYHLKHVLLHVFTVGDNIYKLVWRQPFPVETTLYTNLHVAVIRPNKKISMSVHVACVHFIFGCQICTFFFFFNDMCIQKPLKWKRKTKEQKKNKLQNDFLTWTCWRNQICLFGKSGQYLSLFLTYCKIDIKKG